MMGENLELSERRGTPTLGKSSVDFHASIIFCDGTIAVLTYTRININYIIFEIFVRSVNFAIQRKLNSFIIFILNLNELRAKYQVIGFYAWANKNGYWDCNRAETIMSGFIITLSRTLSLSSRIVASQNNEIILKCSSFNIFAGERYYFDRLIPSEY